MTRFSMLLALFHLTTINLAAPNPSRSSARQFEAAITFIGAGPDPPSYFQLFPTDASLQTISKFPNLSMPLFSPPLPISKQTHNSSKKELSFTTCIHHELHIYVHTNPKLTRPNPLTDNTLSVSQINSVGGAICSFFGADGSDTFLAGEETVDVGPPQVQVSGVCDEE